MNLNFDFAEPVWWRPAYYSFTNSDLLDNIAGFLRKSDNIFGTLSKPALLEFDQFYKIQYTREILIGERNIADHLTIDHVENIALSDLETTSLENKKIKNLYNAVCAAFPSTVLHAPNSFNISSFTIDFANEIHSILAKDLIEPAGKYRGFDVKPAGENFEYLPFEEIDDALEKLFENSRLSLHQVRLQSTHCERIKYILKITAQFLNTFLYIHPYANGNGRIARILASLLLTEISLVPVALTDNTNREIYLQTLREVHCAGRQYQHPDALATLLLERVYSSLYFVYSFFVF